MDMNAPITITLVPELLCTWFVVALVGGGLAGLIVRLGRVSMLTCLIAGGLGGVIGSAWMVATQMDTPEFLAGGPPIRYIDLLVVFIGAVLVLLFDLLIRRRGPPPA